MPETKEMNVKEAISDCYREAILLSEVLQGIDHLADSGDAGEGARYAINTVAIRQADELASQIERIEREFQQ